MKLIGLTRVSTQEQANSGLGLMAQENAIRAYCQAYGHELVRVYVEHGVSASASKRPVLDRALAALAGCDGLVVAKLDRLSRSVLHLYGLLDGPLKGRDFISVGEAFRTDTAAGRMIVGILGTIAQWEREIIVERTRAALGALAADGRKRGGLVPYGYDAAPDGRLTLNPAEQEALAFAREMRAAGATLRAVAAALDAKGIPAKQGGKWSPGQLHRIIGKPSMDVK